MQTITPTSSHQFPVWYLSIAGLCCLCIAIGLCRFAYTPIVPALINQHWVTLAGASYLGTINFFGYFIGAFLGQRANQYFEISSVIKTNLVISTIALALCGIHLGFIWIACWRFIAGATGGILMVVTPSTILKKIPIHDRGKTSGIMFTGIGIGIILSSLFFPFLISKTSITSAWLTAATLAFIATFIAWPAFSKKYHAGTTQLITKTSISKNIFYSIILLTVAYSFFAIGQIPHSLFFVDYVHRELNLSLVKSGMFWTVFGIASLIGPFFFGYIADKVGVYKGLLIALFLCFISALIVIFNKIMILYVVSSFLMGASLPGIVTLMSLRLIELVGTDLHAIFWGRITLYYALIQVAGTYGMSYLLHLGFNYTDCFIIAGVAFLIAFFIVLFSEKKRLI
jgi:predicted MFS family arabinose efflux permease